MTTQPDDVRDLARRLEDYVDDGEYHFPDTAIIVILAFPENPLSNDTNTLISMNCTHDFAKAILAATAKGMTTAPVVET